MPWSSMTPLPAPTEVPVELIIKHWARQLWKSGVDESYWRKFMGYDSSSIIHIKEELHKGSGDTIIIPLRMPLVGAGVIEDNILEGNEEALSFRDFSVPLSYVRHATKIKGEFEEQKTQINLRTESSIAMKDWLARYIDLAIFAMYTGTPFPLIRTATDLFPFTIEPPTSDRVMFAGSATSEAKITAADTFNTALISMAKRKAIEDEVRAIRPVRVDGKDTYVMVIDHWQARDLRADPKWLEAQQHANVRGNNNPIFSGAIGTWDGVVVHENGRVPRTNTGAGGTTVGHALLLGAQSMVFAEGRAPKVVVKKFDFDNQYAVSIGRMFGLKRSMFRYDNVNWTDYGCLNIMTASMPD